MSIKDITVVITSFKSDEIIRNCLNSIDRQYRVILVENSNDSEFKKNIEQEFSNVECILTGKNFGYGKANNIGLKKVKTKYALILNPDATLHTTTLENFFKTIKQIPEFAIIGPHIQEKKDENKKIDNYSSSPILVKNVKGFAMFLNMSEFQDIGFFDENFFIYFLDNDFGRKAISQKKSIIQVFESKAIHSHGSLKVKNFFKKIFIRNYHFTMDELYYYFKINEHHEMLNKLEKKIPNYLIKSLLNIFILRLFNEIVLNS